MVWCGIACFLAGSVFGYLVACYGYMLIKKEEKEKNNHA